jgi:hypothetical protein
MCQEENFFSGYKNLASISAMIGRVIIDNMVEVKIVFDANPESFPYLSASIAVVVAAGIADESTTTPVVSGSACSSVSTPNNNAGMTISLKKE